MVNPESWRNTFPKPPVPGADQFGDSSCRADIFSNLDAFRRPKTLILCQFLPIFPASTFGEVFFVLYYPR